MNELNIINSEVVTVEDKDFFNNQIDLIINQHKNNAILSKTRRLIVCRLFLC